MQERKWNASADLPDTIETENKETTKSKVFSKIKNWGHFTKIFTKNGWKNIPIYAMICYDKAEKRLPQKCVKAA